MDLLKRKLIVLVAGLAGGLVAVGYGWLTWPQAMESARSMPKADAEWIKNSAIFEACVVLFAATYCFGRLLARLFASPALAEEIRRRSRWHLRLLIVATALFGIQRWWIANRRGGTRWDDGVAIAVGLGFAAVAVAFEIGRLRQERSPQS